MKLDELPPELVLAVSRYLSPADTSCLALCNHHFMAFSSSPSFDNLLGKPRPTSRKRGPRENHRIDLLTRLGRDLPHYYLCFGCLRLHLWRYVELPSPNFELRSCFFDEGDRAVQKGPHLSPLQFSGFATWSSYKFHFVHLCLVMRRHYLGSSYGIPAESLLYTEVRNILLEIDNLQSPRRTGLMSVDARVCHNPSSLCLRIQSLTVVKRQEAPTLFRQGQSLDRDLSWSCPHNDPADSIRLLIQNYCQHDRHDSDQLFSRGRCGKCNTSWDIEVREIEDEKLSLILTQWKDLGPGLDPEDQRWRSNQDIYWAWPASGWKEVSKPLKEKEMVEDPRVRFETLSEGCNSLQALSTEEMVQRNMSLLRGERYRAVMRPLYGWWWYLQGKERHSKKKGEPKYSRCTII